MPEQTDRFKWVARFARLVFVGTLALLTVALIGSVAMVIMTMMAADPGASGEGLAPIGGGANATSGTEAMLWVVVVVAELLGLLWAVVAYGLVRAIIGGHATTEVLGARVSRVEALLEEASQGIKDLAELAPLSDRAKRLLHRDREVESLREAIHEDIIRQDFARAEELANTIEAELGYAEEAAEMHKEIDKSRDATVEEKLDLAVARIDELCNDRKWDRALREAQRVIRLFPDNPKVGTLPDRILKARNDVKRLLLQEYGEAVRKNDVDSGIRLLQELDLYLTPQEGAALQESARGVFKARLHNLGVQFAICVADHRWDDAIAAGEGIIAEFPNSRFSQEVQEKMPLLRSRAQSSQTAAKPAEA